MTLPDTIRINPLSVPIHAEISIPGSKSLTNRALILAVLGSGPTELHGALWAEDTELMVKALRQLGFQIEVKSDSSNSCNRNIVVEGQNGKIPATKADLYVGTAGTAARFLTALCALGSGSYRIDGSERMQQRPMREIFEAIIQLGAKVDSPNGLLPATISGPLTKGKVSVADTESSQFASALLLLTPANKGIQIEYPPSPYVEMTRKLIESWPAATPRKIQIEPDASSASYFIALNRLNPGFLNIPGWNKNSSQVDAFIANDKLWRDFQNADFEISRKTELGDAVMTLVIAAAALKKSLRLKDAANLRNQECDRITSLRTELEKCGVPAEETQDSLSVHPTAQFKKAVIETHKDHRMAMCFATLGTIDVMKDGEPWITIKDPACVEKTFPNFFETLHQVAKQSYAQAKKSFRPIILHQDGTSIFPS
jgi:3-phosphoshikimate 1-carboxyvinyltransferase